MAKAVEIMDDNIVITSPSRYLIHVKGEGGCLLNRLDPAALSKGDVEGNPDQAIKSKEDQEWTTWKNKLYVREGMVSVPGENPHEMLKSACRYWGAKIPGDGKKTWTDVFAKAVICESFDFGIPVDDSKIIPFQKAVAVGSRNKSKVLRIRPMIQPWEATCRVHAFDARISYNVMKTVWLYAGAFIGFGDWRPVYGRFNVVSVEKEM